MNLPGMVSRSCWIVLFREVIALSFLIGASSSTDSLSTSIPRHLVSRWDRLHILSKAGVAQLSHAGKELPNQAHVMNLNFSYFWYAS